MDVAFGFIHHYGHVAFDFISLFFLMIGIELAKVNTLFFCLFFLTLSLPRSSPRRVSHAIQQLQHDPAIDQSGSYQASFI